MRASPAIVVGVASLLACAGYATPARAQRPPPPIVTDFDGETQADRADLPATPPPAPPVARPLPPIVTEFDAPPEGEDGAYEPRIDEDEDQGDPSDDAIVDDEDPAEARRHLQHALLVERRRQMARGQHPSGARLLASPWRSSTDPTREAGTSAEERRGLVLAVDRLELGVVSANAPVVATTISTSGLANRIGLGLDAFREPEGVRVRFEPVGVLSGRIEAPSELVRGAFALTASYRTVHPSLPIALFVGGGFEHVSDFSTVTSIDPVMTNAIVARGGLLFDVGAMHGLARASLGVHVASSTVAFPVSGFAQSAELALDLVLRSGSPTSAIGNVQLCGAVHGSYLAPSDLLIEEEVRFAAMVGGCVRDTTMGELSLLAEVTAGSIATWDRRRRAESVGVSLRWSL